MTPPDHVHHAEVQQRRATARRCQQPSGPRPRDSRLRPGIRGAADSPPLPGSVPARRGCLAPLENGSPRRRKALGRRWRGEPAATQVDDGVALDVLHVPKGTGRRRREGDDGPRPPTRRPRDPARPEPAAPQAVEIERCQQRQRLHGHARYYGVQKWTDAPIQSRRAGPPFDQPPARIITAGGRVKGAPHPSPRSSWRRWMAREVVNDRSQSPASKKRTANVGEVVLRRGAQKALGYSLPASIFFDSTARVTEVRAWAGSPCLGNFKIAIDSMFYTFVCWARQSHSIRDPQLSVWERENWRGSRGKSSGVRGEHEACPLVRSALFIAKALMLSWGDKVMARNATSGLGSERPRSWDRRALRAMQADQTSRPRLTRAQHQTEAIGCRRVSSEEYEG